MTSAWGRASPSGEEYCGPPGRRHSAGAAAATAAALRSGADHVGRQANHLGHTACHRDLIGDGLGHDLDIGDDSRLAGVNHIVTLLVAAKHPAFNQAHTAGTANPGTTIVRQINAIHQGPVEHEVAAIRQVRLIVEGYLANLPHYSTSRRIGR